VAVEAGIKVEEDTADEAEGVVAEVEAAANLPN
jgi:hypothetical protein